MSDEQWDGDERRSIPIHVLEHMDRRLERYENTMRMLVDNHTKDEMDRYNQILVNISETRAASEKRHAELTDLLVRHITATEESLNTILSGFPKNKDGSPDLSGHNEDHTYRRQEAEDAREFRKYIKRTVAAGVVLAASVWLGPVLLKALVAFGAQ